MTEASRRFGIPEHWIRAVIQVESAVSAQAVSPRGALGLMQIMPDTWVELSVRCDLGVDPFDPHDNVLAGAAYLREMLDRFGRKAALRPTMRARSATKSILPRAARFPE